MGQRHQAFLIAKIRPYGSPDAQYRCIAAYNHSWCYGSLPLRAVHRLVTLLKQPENAAVIREELRLLDGKYGLFNERELPIPGIPCRFTTTLLGAAWDMDFTREVGYLSSGYSLEAGMGSWDGDNNDGITVVDVTNPEEPAYCFLANGSSPLSGLRYVKRYYDVKAFHSRVRRRQVIPDIPEDASDTLRKAHNEQLFQQSILETVDSLDGVRLLSLSALAEAWPGEYSPKVKPSQADLGASPPKDTPAIDGAPSLVDATFRQTLEQSLHAGATVELDELLTFPEKMRVVEDVLSNFKLLPPSDAAGPLVTKLAESKYRHHYLDLAGYTFSDAQVLTAVRSLPEIHILNLSRNLALTTEGVRNLLANVPSLQSLVLLDCPRVDADELAELTHEERSIFRNLLFLAHPAFMLESPSGMNHSIGISIFWDDGPGHPPAGVTLPFLNPAYVLQGLIDIVTAADGNYSFWTSAGRVVQVAYSALPRKETRSWGERVITAPQSLEQNLLSEHKWVLMLSGGLLEGRLYAFLRVREEEIPEAASKDKGKSTSRDVDEFVSRDETSASGGEEVSASDNGDVTASGGEDVSTPIDKQGEKQDTGGDSLQGGQPLALESSRSKDKYPKAIKRFPRHELHDLRSFVSTTMQEGYAPVPERIVSQLEALMSKSSWRIVDSNMTRKYY